MKKLIISCTLLLSIPTLQGAHKNATLDKPTYTFPAAKHTELGKYLTSHEAYKLVHAKDVLFIDIRDAVEIAHSGHPEPIDAIVPLRIQSTEFDFELGEFKLVDNPNFLDEMQNVLELKNKTQDDMIIIICGSGYRSAEAVNILAANGYTNAWHIPDGYAGDEKKGTNAKNAWQLAGLPWSHEIVHGSHWRIHFADQAP